MTALLQTMLSLILSFASLFPTAEKTTIDQIVAILQAAIPVIEDGYTDLAQPVKNIIALLQQSGNLTADQIAAVDALDASSDAAFEAAAKTAGPTGGPV